LVYQVARRAQTAWPDFRYLHEAALLTAAGVGTHALVDNCWTIPVTVSSLIVLALADPLPLARRQSPYRWTRPQLAFASLLLTAVYIVSTAVPALGLYYNDKGHQAYDRDDFANAERYHLAAIALIPNQPVFLDNLGMLYLQRFTEQNDALLLFSA